MIGLGLVLSLALAPKGVAGEAPYVGPLDAFAANVLLALGTQKLFSAYALPCLRARNSAGNSERDFGFDAAGAIDSAGISSWLNGAEGFVTTLYNQASNAHHFGQTTGARQPALRLHDADWGGHASVVFDGVNDSISDTTTGLSIVSLFTGFKYESSQSIGRILSGPGGYDSILSNEGFEWQFRTNGASFDIRSIAPGCASFEMVFTGSGGVTVMNGIETSIPTMDAFDAGQTYTIGDYTDGGGQNLGGSLAYCILLDRALDTTERLTLRTALNAVFFS